MRMNAKYLEDDGQVSLGRCRIQSVSASNSYKGTGERYYKFHNGTSSSGDVKLTVYVPTSDSSGFYGSCPVSIDIPGMGILFEDGIFMSTNLDAGTGDNDDGIGMTCFYVGSVPA